MGMTCKLSNMPQVGVSRGCKYSTTKNYQRSQHELLHFDQAICTKNWGEKAVALRIAKPPSTMISVLVPYLGQLHRSLSQPFIAASSIKGHDKHIRYSGQTVSRHQTHKMRRFKC
jgi:hypothetical protein